MRDKKAQAALEFLMTYGWAILVVLVVIGALAYFGVLNPSILLPEKCTMQLGMYCQDHRIDGTTNRITMKFVNGMGRDIIITSINITGDALETSCVTGRGVFTNTIEGAGDCNDSSCVNCPGWPGTGGPYYYACNPHSTMSPPYYTVSSVVGNVGMVLEQGDGVDLIVNCTLPIRPTRGRVKNKIVMTWFDADTSDFYTHTMYGELMASVER